MTRTTSPTDQGAELRAELRAEIARQMVPLYVLAPLVGLHPANLGGVLRGKRELTPEMAERIRAALEQVRAATEKDGAA